MTITIYAVGDVMLGDHPICLGHGVGSKIKKFGSKYIFLDVSSMLRRGDIVFGNLEVILSNQDLDPNDPRSMALRGDPNSIEGLKYCGFNVLSIANNHSLQHGMSALKETTDILTATDIRYIPGLSNEREAQYPSIICVNGVKIGFLAYCFVPGTTSFGFTSDPDQIINEIKIARNACEILVLSLHWGYEYIKLPSPKQIHLAHQFVDAGADLIIGHHPHVLQGIECYNNKLIIYSLGNFVFDMWQRKMREGAIMEFLIDEQNPKRIKYRIHPTFINLRYQPQVLSGNSKAEAINNIIDISKSINATKHVDIEQSHYLQLVEIATKKYQRDVKIYFIRNIYRYSVVTIFSLLGIKLKSGR